MIETAIRQRLEHREDSLSPYAARSTESQGRAVPEDPCTVRTEFQRDRDRIIHSMAFRRLKHKTQVFIAPSGDHYVTRLTHTLEVAQIARTIARALDLNEDLTEAIGLAHDLGHTPFGHAGEGAVNDLRPEGFRHSEQSLRVVDHLEKDGKGLNLTYEVRQGILHHSKARGDFLGATLPDGLTLEAQICRLSDALAYLNHDLDDTFRAGVLRAEDLPAEVSEVLGLRHSQRINTMVTDVVRASWAASGSDGTAADTRPDIVMSPRVRDAMNVLREFMFEKIYVPQDGGEAGQTARNIVRLLYRVFMDDPAMLPSDLAERAGPGDRVVVDYVAGMTDLYAARQAERIEPGIADGLRSTLV